MVERFWAYVERGAPAECWPWAGRRDAQGYGRIQVGTTGAGRKIYGAHRVSLELKLGRPLTAEECTLHSCDHPWCVNPGHLRAGSRAENNADMLAKGRQARGERMPQAKLTDAQAAEVRRRMLLGESGPKVAAEFGISSRLAYCIRDGVKRREPAREVVSVAIGVAAPGMTRVFRVAS